jgi:transcription elongation factor Elf1
MDSALDNQVVKFTCPHCASQMGERIARLKTNPQITCSTCEGDIQIYADQLRDELAKVDRALAEHRRRLDQVLSEHWRKLQSASQ